MGLLKPTKGIYRNTVNTDDPNKYSNPNLDNKLTKKAFRQTMDPNAVNTGVTYDHSIVNYTGTDGPGTTTATIGNDMVFDKSGTITSNAMLKNNVKVMLNGTLGDNLPLLRKLNRRNWMGSHGFRGKGWDNGMTEEEKAAFKEANPIYVKGRTRQQYYNFQDPSSAGSVNNNTNYTYGN